MKKAEQILNESCDSFGIAWTERRKEQTIKAMELYANEKLEKASELAYQAIVNSNKSASEIEQEILKLKDL